MPYEFDPESWRRNFPEGYPVPELLTEFGAWLRDRDFGELGFFRLRGERFDDHWIEDGADLHPFFAFFLRDPTGGQVGFWLEDGPSTEAPPVVFLGSEGEVAVLSDTLGGFLRRLARGETGVDDLDDAEGAPAARAALSAWLVERGVAPGADVRRGSPDLQIRLDAWGEARRAAHALDPDLAALSDRLRSYARPNARASFAIVVVGRFFGIWRMVHGPKRMTDVEAEGLEAPLRALREKSARANPARGAWFSAWLTVPADVAFSPLLARDWLNPPVVVGTPVEVPASELLADLAAFPRSPHWTPTWLTRLAETAM